MSSLVSFHALTSTVNDALVLFLFFLTQVSNELGVGKLTTHSAERSLFRSVQRDAVGVSLKVSVGFLGAVISAVSLVLRQLNAVAATTDVLGTHGAQVTVKVTDMPSVFEMDKVCERVTVFNLFAHYKSLLR